MKRSARLPRITLNCPSPQHKDEKRRFFFENPNFSYGEAIVYHGLLRHLRPQRVIEVGSGYPTAVLLDTLDISEIRADCTCIEPFPELLLSLIRPEVQTSLADRLYRAAGGRSWDLLRIGIRRYPVHSIRRTSPSRKRRRHNLVRDLAEARFRRVRPLSRHLLPVRVPERLGFGGPASERDLPVACSSLPTMPSFQVEVFQLFSSAAPP